MNVDKIRDLVGRASDQVGIALCALILSGLICWFIFTMPQF
jgi:hypothetical protein